MKNLVLCMFLITGLVLMIGCVGQAPQASNSGPATSRDSNGPKLAGAGQSKKKQAPVEEEKAEEKDESVEDAGNDEPANLDDSEAVTPPPQNATRKKVTPARRDRFGKPMRDIPSIVGGGSGGGGGQAVSDNETGSQRNVSNDNDASEDVSAAGGSNVADDQTNNQTNNRTNNTPDPEPTSFMDLAEDAFARQQEIDAFQYLYAHVLTDKNALRENSMSWYTGLSEDEENKFMEPRLALRWGIGIIYDVSGGFEGDPPVIGDSEAASSGGGGGGDSGDDLAGGPPSSGNLGVAAPPTSRNRRFGGSSPSSSSANKKRGSGGSNDREAKPPLEELAYFTGDYGHLFLERLDMRRTHDGGFYGKILSEVNPQLLGEIEQVSNTPNQSTNNSAPAAGGDDDLGFLTGGSDTPQGPARNTGNDNSGSSRSDRNNDDDGPQTGLQPGVTMVGVDKLEDLLSKAKAMGVDILAVFEVDVKHSERSSKTSSTTRLAIYNVRDGVLVKKGKTLTSTSVAKAREKSSDDDPVELALDVVFSDYADEQWRGTEFPKSINKDNVGNRIKSLLDSKPENPLPALVEIKQFHIMDFIDKFEMSNAFSELIGGDAAKDLIEGSDSAKRKALAKWMPGNFDVGPSSSSSGSFR